jgi:putative membrane protein
MYSYGGRFCNGFLPFGNVPYGGSIMMGLGLILILALAYFIFRNNGPVRNSSGSGETALEMLQKRYVGGEISQEEYQEKRNTLKGNK